MFYETSEYTVMTLRDYFSYCGCQFNTSVFGTTHQHALTNYITLSCAQSSAPFW